MQRIFWCTFFFLLIGLKSSAQILNIEDKRFRLRDSTDFQATLTLGWNIHKNTATIWTGMGSFLAEKNQNKHFFLAFGFFNLLRTDANNLLNDRILHLRHNFDLQPWLVWENFVQGQYNEQFRIQHRYLAGSGLRLKMRQLVGLRMYLGLAGMLEQMAFQQDNSQIQRARMSTYLSVQIPLQNGVKIGSTTYFQPVLLDWSQHRISSQTSIEMPLGKALSFKTAYTLLLDNDRRIEVSVPDFTYQWTNALVWKMGRRK